MNESTDSTTTSGARERASTRARASHLKQRLKQDGREKVESGKRAAADQIAEIADAIDLAGSQLDQSQPTLANYASKLADGVGSLAARLREDSIEDLYREVRQLATRHPGMFVLGSAALGLVIARFMKASGDEEYAVEYSADEGLGATAESEAQQWGEAGTGEQGSMDPSFHRQGATPDSPGSAQRGV